MEKCKQISIDDCCRSSPSNTTFILIVHPCLQLGGEAEDLSVQMSIRQNIFLRVQVAGHKIRHYCLSTRSSFVMF